MHTFPFPYEEFPLERNGEFVTGLTDLIITIGYEGRDWQIEQVALVFCKGRETRAVRAPAPLETKIINRLMQDTGFAGDVEDAIVSDEENRREEAADARCQDRLEARA